MQRTWSPPTRRTTLKRARPKRPTTRRSDRRSRPSGTSWRESRTMEATRVLVFNGDPRSDKRFQLCRTAVLNAGDRKGARDRETIRKEARILDALDAISEPDPRGP